MPNGKRTADGTSAHQPGGRNDGKPAKRSRVSRACDQCRASRERCDGASQCQTCASQDRTCTYNAQPKKRGIQPNYIRTLELTLAWLFQSFPEAESQLAQSLPLNHPRVTGLLRGKDPEDSETLHLAWRNSLICKQIDQLLSGELIETDGPRLAETGGDAADVVTGVLPPYQSPPLSVPLEHNVLQQNLSDVETAFDARGLARDGEHHQRFGSHQRLVKLPDNALTLLEHYFAFTHSWLPMTEKHSMLKLLYSYPNEGHPRDQLTSAGHAELWSIMALAASQVSDAAHEYHSHHISNFAEELISSVHDNTSYEVPHIRAMMILALVNVNEGRMLAAWLRIGSVVSLLLLFRILETLNVTEKWCRHMHLAAYVVETAIASHLQVPAHLRVSYIDAIGFVDEDGLEEWATWQDPLETAGQNNQSKAPARSFSTLNELVRRSMRSQRDSVTYSPESGRGSGEGSVVFSLLQNATMKQNRIQPSVLVAAYDKRHDDARLASEGSADPNSIAGGATTTNRPFADTDWAQQSATDVTGVKDQHRFMSVPNETGSFPFPENLDVSDAGQSGPLFWTTSPSGSQVADFSSLLGDHPVPGADIFEQFDALERRDTNQHSQFYQNLGFAPDVELAEFFGSDYQPSDPLLAYLNPTLYGVQQENGSIVPDTG